jgi:hypothetical protein
VAVAVGAALTLAAVVFFQRALAGRVADLDSFYHLGHASAYVQGSLLDTSFPWARYSVIGAWGADLWWGFHLLLAPFAAFWDLPGSIPVVGVVLTSCLLAGVLHLAVKHAWVWPWMWPLFFLVAVPNVLYRLLMVRPHVLSLLAVLVLLSALTRGRLRMAGVFSALLVWIHAGIFWMPVLVLLAYGGATLLDRRFVAGDGTPLPKRLLRPSLAVGSGIAAGILLRPHPLSTIRLVDVQIVQLLRGQADAVPLSFGGELIPLPAAALGPSSWVLLLPWALAMTVLIWSTSARSSRLEELPRGDRLLLFTSGALSLLFLTVALTVAGRALVEWAAFATILVATAWSRIPRSRGVRTRATGMTGLVAMVALPWIAGWHAMNIRLNALPADHLRQAATWMAERSEEGDVVFHAHWDNFAPLFGWNRTNHYLGGMDPIFQHAYDPELYWKHAHLARGAMTATTCGAFPCPPGAEVDTHTALVADFGARWVLVEPRRNPALFEYLTRDRRFDLSLRTRSEAVFEVLR